MQVPVAALGAQRDVAPGHAQPERRYGFRRTGNLLRCRTGERLACSRELGLFGAIGKDAVVTNAHETGRQHMQQEAADELGGWQRHDSAPVAMGVILVAKAHAGVSET